LTHLRRTLDDRTGQADPARHTGPVSLERWLALCRAIAADIREALAALPTRIEREESRGLGEGGDETTAIDAVAEAAAVRRIEELHAGGVELTLVSEELGRRQLGASPEWTVVLDPIDGSINAKRGIPFFSLSVAVARGDTMDDVVFGYVHDFGSGEEWTAQRGGGARLDGAPLDGLGPKDEIELLSFEATMTSYVVDRAPAFLSLAPRMRIMGSLALSLCHLAAGRVDAVVSLKPIRSVDIAAGQLLVRERGLAVALPDVDEPFAAAKLDLRARSRIVAAGSAQACARLATALTA
jgi:myo-inositol-1(or 4)-monophosphatase